MGQQARGLERRRRLVAAAIEQFSRRGSRGTGIAAVAAAAGVTRGALLHHFGSKEGLLRAVLQERDEREQTRWEHIVEPGGLETIRRLHLIADSWREEAGVARLHAVLLAESLDDEGSLHDYFVRRQSALRADLRGAIARGQEAGEIRAEVDARLTAIEISSFLDGIIVEWQLDPTRIPLEDVFAHLVARLADALGT